LNQFESLTNSLSLKHIQEFQRKETLKMDFEQSFLVHLGHVFIPKNETYNQECEIIFKFQHFIPSMAKLNGLRHFQIGTLSTLTSTWIITQLGGHCDIFNYNFLSHINLRTIRKNLQITSIFATLTNALRNEMKSTINHIMLNFQV